MASAAPIASTEDPVSMPHEKGSAMTHTCCRDCRLRLAPADAPHLVTCPECGEPLQTLAGLDELLGFRLFRLEDVPHSLPEAVAVSVPIPDPGGGRS